jgi:Protein of unknown function (DUF2591)
MRVDDLAGAQLDYYVARAEGLPADLIRANGLAYCRIDVPYQGHQLYVPTHNWQLLGPIMVRQRYLLYPRLDAETGKTVWLAEAQLNFRFHGMYIADEPELALCRLRVAESFGENVPCP